MQALLSRIFRENRRLLIPLVGALALNVLLFVGIVYPLSARARSVQARASAAATELQAADREDAAARAVEKSREHTDAALKAFYDDVLPPNLAQARRATYLRLSQLAEQHNLQQTHRQTDPKQREPESSLTRMRITMSLEGDYDDIREFIYQLESGTDFIVIDSIGIRQGADAGSALALDLMLSTYYHARPNG
jgi:hypothetical protein